METALLSIFQCSSLASDSEPATRSVWPLIYFVLEFALAFIRLRVRDSSPAVHGDIDTVADGRL